MQLAAQVGVGAGVVTAVEFMFDIIFVIDTVGVEISTMLAMWISNKMKNMWLMTPLNAES